ncbi:MAG: nuclear transport factor 2 family protein [Candidatus Manganitrophaceae bacterium]|nr:MAG: nuclear transport factor 2 family protein [Candidatus Manganitrophaceae bacterium]
MSAEENITVVREHYNAFNKRDFGYGSTLVDPGLRWINVPFATTYEGPEGYKQFLKMWTTAMSDARVEITNVIASGDWVAVEFTGKGTHQSGPLAGPKGPIPPTGKSIELSFCEVFKLKNGKIALVRAYFDAATLMRQLGLMP